MVTKIQTGASANGKVDDVKLDLEKEVRSTKPIPIQNADALTRLLSNKSKHPPYHVLLYPDAAQALLDINKANRVITPPRVNYHAKNLEAGRWMVTTDGIGIDWNGDLFNGQHRLLACIQAKLPIEIVLHTGLDPKTRFVTDTGKSRSLFDTLLMAGHNTSTTDAAAGRLLYLYQNDILTSSRQPIPHEVLLEYITDVLKPERLHNASLIGQNVRRQVPGSNQTALAAFFYLANQNDPFTAARFEDRLATGANLKVNDPLLTLRNLLAAAQSRTARNRTWHLMVYIKAWNADITNKNLRALMWRQDEPILKMVQVHKEDATSTVTQEDTKID